MSWNFASIRRSFFDHPLVARELAVGLTAGKMAMVFSLVVLAYGIVDGGILLILLESGGRVSGGMLGALFHLAHTSLAFGLLTLLLPLRVAGHIEGPRAGRAFDQVVVTGISPLRMTFGNWVFALVYAAQLLLVSLPFSAVAHSFGGVSWSEVFQSYGLLLIYGNVIIAVTLGCCVAEREWLGVPGAIFIFVVLGSISGHPEVRALVALCTPLRLLYAESFSTIEGSGQSLDLTPIVLGQEVPVALYTAILWVVIAAPFLVLVVFGPAHDFVAGLNVFGSVQAPGTEKRRRVFRRLRAALTRRVEVAFYYENQPAWCQRWEFLARVGIGCVCVLAVWVICASFVPPNRGWSFSQDSGFHLPFLFMQITFVAWILSLGQTKSRMAYRVRLGGRFMRRGLVHDACFLLLASCLFLLCLLIDSTRLAPTSGGSQSYSVYEGRLHNYVLATLIALSQLYLFGRLTLKPISNPGAWRGLMFFGVFVVAFAPLILTAILQELVSLERVSPLLSWPAFASPFSLFQRDFAWDERFFRFVVVHLVFAGLQVSLGLMWMARFRREATKAPRTNEVGAGATVLLIALGTMIVSARTARAQNAPDALRRAGVDLVEITRGFDGVVFEASTDFYTLVVANRSPDTVRVVVRFADYSDPGVESEVGAQTTSTLRLEGGSAGRSLTWPGAPVQLEVHAGDAAHLFEVAPARVLIAAEESFLLVSENGDRAYEWASARAQRDEFRSVRPSVLPESALHYEGVSAVVIGDVDLSRRTTAQRRALLDFVRLGGTLVLTSDVRIDALQRDPDWGEVWASATERLESTDFGDFKLIRFDDGEEHSLELAGSGGTPSTEVTVISRRDVGFGSICHLAFSPMGRLPPAESLTKRFWSQLSGTIPRSQFPVSFQARNRRLPDSPQALGSAMVFYGIYLLLIGPCLLLVFRGRQRRVRLWIYVVALPIIFALLTPLLQAVIHSHSSFGSEDVLEYVPARGQAGAIAQIRLRSSGRQRHRLEVVGRDVSTFDESWSSVEARSEAAEHRMIQLDVVPWGRGSANALAWSDRPRGATAHATALPNGQIQVTASGIESATGGVFAAAFVFGDGVSEDARTVPLVGGTLKVKLRTAKRSSTRSQRNVSRLGRTLDDRGDIVWGGSRIRIGSRGERGPVVYLLWEASRRGGALRTQSDEVSFRRSLSVTGELQREQLLSQPQVIEESGELYESFRRRFILMEVPVTQAE